MDKKFITKDTNKYTEKYTWPIVIKISSKLPKNFTTGSINIFIYY